MIFKKLHLLCFVLGLLLIQKTHGQSNKDILDSINNEINSIRQSTKYNSFSKDTIEVNLSLFFINKFDELEPKLALQKAEEALKLAKKSKFSKGEILVQQAIGQIYTNIGDFELARKTLQKAINNPQANNFPKILGDCYFVLAQGELIQNHFPIATNWLNKALKQYEISGDKVKEARIYNNFAILYGKQNQVDKEVAFYERALDVIKNDRSPEAKRLREIVELNLALNFRDEGNYDKAFTIFNKNYESKKHLNSNDKARAARYMGSVLKHMKKWDESLLYFEESLFIYKKTENKSGIGDISREIGEVYFLKKDFEKAKMFSLEGLKYSSEIGELESVKFSCENLSKIYQALGDYKNAYNNQVLFKRYSDSMFNADINNRVYELQMNYEFEQKEFELKKQQEEKDKQRKIEAEKEKKLKYIIIISLFLVSLFAISVYYNLKEHKKQRAIVENQKEQIQQSLIEKETLLKEIHHRVKNNLQIISSLLNMQSQGIDDEKVLSTIREGQSRVQAMSLIHQSLYQSENINQVDVESYLKDLIDYLKSVYQPNNKIITIHLKTENIHFDFDTAIPLGLIVNELVSNAYKHGFKNNVDGNIWIEIFKKNEVEYELFVKNDGDCFQDEVLKTESNSLGLKLVAILAKQLRGSFKFSCENKITICSLLFKDVKTFHSKTNSK